MKQKDMDKKSTSFSSPAFQKRLEKIDSAIIEEDWFSGFALAVTYFEHYGYWAIRFYCLREKIELTNKADASLKKLGAVQLALFLRVLKLINNQTYSNMKKVVEERNKIVHPGRDSILYPDKKEKDEATMLLKQAKDCLLQIRITAPATQRTKDKKVEK